MEQHLRLAAAVEVPGDPSCSGAAGEGVVVVDCWPPGEEERVESSAAATGEHWRPVPSGAAAEEGLTLPARRCLEVEAAAVPDHGLESGAGRFVTQ